MSSYSAMCVLEKITAVRFAAAIAAKLNPQIQMNTTTTTTTTTTISSSINDSSNSSNSGSGGGGSTKRVGYANGSNSSSKSNSNSNNSGVNNSAILPLAPALTPHTEQFQVPLAPPLQISLPFPTPTISPVHSFIIHI